MQRQAKLRAAVPDLILLTTAEAAARLHVSTHTLIDWRRPGHRGRNLPWVRLGKRLFYRADDVADFMARSLRERRYAVSLLGSGAILPEHVARAA